MSAYHCAAVFDGDKMHTNAALLIEDGVVAAVVDRHEIPDEYSIQSILDRIISPGFVDLQVNGGDGIMFNDDPSVEALRRISRAHRKTGTTALLPTLITDSAQTVAIAIEAVSKAIQLGIPGIEGLHIEGPHLSKEKKGAHDPTLIRPMDTIDLEMLCGAATSLPSLLVTVAPETVTPEQIEQLCCAGAVVSLGHSNANYKTCLAAVQAGARCVTHLFNAMSQVTGREPGLVGAALGERRLSVGLIVDGHHVHPANVSLAYHSKANTEGLFLVTDAMAPAGTSVQTFKLGGRLVERENGRLELADGTLAGADIDMPTCIRNLQKFAKIPLQNALACATRIPATMLGRSSDFGSLKPGMPARFVISDAGLSIHDVVNLSGASATASQSLG